MPAEMLRRADPSSVFPGDSEVARLARAIDWSATSLGALDAWSDPLRLAVRMAMECPFPFNLWCGPELLLIYNDAYRVVLGAKHPRALGRPGPEVWAEIWPEVEQIFSSIHQGGPAVYAEDARFVMERSEGPPGEAWFTFSVSPIRDERGGIVAFLNVATETTARIQTERELDAALEESVRATGRLRDVFAQAPAFLAVLRGPEHVFEVANDAYLRIVGRQDILGKRVVDALPEVVEQGFIALLDRVYATGEPFVGREVPIRLQQPSTDSPVELYLDFVYQPLTDGEGRNQGIVVHGSDVTQAVRARQDVERLFHESERAHAEALESESRYRFLANSIPVQVWTALPDGGFDYVSERMAASLGTTPDEIIGAGWAQGLHPDDLAITIDRWEHSLTTGEPYEAEFRLWNETTRTYRWHLSRATAQRGPDGRILRWFGSNTDIEDRKQVEAELERLTREATEANRAKSDFLAAMSHELRTPLNAIGGYAQLIEMGVRGPVTEEQRIDLLRIQRSKSHLDSLVSDVLNFAKMGSGRIDLRTTSVNVAQLLASVVEMVSPQAAAQEIALAPLIAPSDLAVRADLDRTRQILINLLANALKFTPAGGGISLDVGTTDTTVALSVSDTGIGIAQTELDRIFEPFVQARKREDPHEHGVGLGLAISRQLARGMEGDLTVRSVVGVGSTFTLVLPRAGRTTEGSGH